MDFQNIMLPLFPMVRMFPMFTIFTSETIGPIYFETSQSLQLTNIVFSINVDFDPLLRVNIYRG